MALPEARIIRVFRNPCDSLLSAYASYFAEYHKYIYDWPSSRITTTHL